MVYNDLISAEDRDFWAYLCEKDFRRLEKLQTQNIGEGYFIDDTSEEESDGDDKLERADSDDKTTEESPGILDFLEKKRSPVIRKRTGPNNRYNNDDDDGDEYDHGNFIENMLNNFNDEKNEIQRKIREEEERQEQLEQQEKSKFGDNQYWQGSTMENQYDIDDLLKDMEWEAMSIFVSFTKHLMLYLINNQYR